MRYRSILPRHKNTNFWSSTIHFVGVDMIKIANSTLIIETYFYMVKEIYCKICSCNSGESNYRHGLDMRDKYANSIINDVFKA